MRFVRRRTGAAGGRSGGTAAYPSSQVRALLRWFASHRRPLPWRRSREPYRIWVAEVLLQQTRVAQATPYFERLIERYPDVRSLAKAPRAELLKLWQGAGYYRRAIRLHEAAQRLVERRGGTLPTSVDQLEELPGVGPYVARAIAAFAHDAPVVPVDANVLRVASRWSGERRDVAAPGVRAALERRLQNSLPRRHPGRFGEALMELGETICLPRGPHCSGCPVSADCRAFRELDDPGEIPRRRPRRPRRHVRAAVVAIARGDRWLVQRRGESGLLAGLWEFPGGKVEPGESPSEAARREISEEVGLRLGPLLRLGEVHHAYSHFTVSLTVFRAHPVGRLARGMDRRWATLAEIERLPVPKATEKILRLLRSTAGAEGTRFSSRGGSTNPGAPRE